MTDRALLAIVASRLHAERRPILYASAIAAAAGLAQPHGLFGPLLLCAPIGIVMALLQGPGRHAHLDLCEESAPLFGRELARAKALAPVAAASIVASVYCAAAAAAGSWSTMDFVLALSATATSTLVALSATTRTGWSRVLYVGLSCAAAAAAYGIATAGSVAGELAFCALASFLALRQYGESLARYDPV